MARASAACTSLPTTPRMSYSRRMLGSNLCAVWLIQKSSVAGTSVARLGTAYPLIGEAQATHLLGIEDIAQIDDARLAHHLLDTPRIEAAKLVPLGDHDQDIRLERRLVGGLGEGDALQDLAQLRHALWIERHDPGPGRLQRRHDVERGRIAHVVGVGLEGQP